MTAFRVLTFAGFMAAGLATAAFAAPEGGNPTSSPPTSTGNAGSAVTTPATPGSQSYTGTERTTPGTPMAGTTHPNGVNTPSNTTTTGDGQVVQPTTPDAAHPGISGSTGGGGQR